MTRKSKRTGKAPPGAATKPAAILSGSKSRIAEKHAIATKNPHTARSAKSTQIQPGSPEPGSSAASVTSSNDEADESDGDGAGADQEEDDDGDGDGIAPSDAAIASNGVQTGRNFGMDLKHTAGTGEESKRSPDKARSKKQQACRRKASKSTGQINDEGAESDDEDDYNGVDLISDSEEEEPTVEELEEKVIIESEEEYDSNCRTPPVLPSISSDGWPGFDLEGDLFLSDVPYFDEQIGRTDPSILAEEIEIFNSTSFSQNFFDVQHPPRLPPPRRVRFADVPEPDNTSAVASETERGEAGVTSEKHGSEEEDSDSSSGRSSGYESGYHAKQYEWLGKTNICTFS